jgi:hypothetical protein
MRIAFTVCTPKTGYRISSDPAGKFTFKPGRGKGANCRNQPERRIKLKIIYMPLGSLFFILGKVNMPGYSFQAPWPKSRTYVYMETCRKRELSFFPYFYLTSLIFEY